MLTSIARAKVNLCLHVTGRRDDGLHLLDSIVVFPEFGDVLDARKTPDLNLEIEGPFADGLEADDDNLVIKAAKMFAPKAAEITLHKNLPLASGIGGGSADAAATIRLMCDLHRLSPPLTNQLLELGADVPVCLYQEPVRMLGIGQQLEKLPVLPEFWIVLVNAGEGVETGAVFRSMKKRDNPQIANIPESFSGCTGFFDFLRIQRNDMEEAAKEISPVISDVLIAIDNTENCALARMSGSGGTCFGLYADKSDAEAAARKIGNEHPDWWVVASKVAGG